MNYIELIAFFGSTFIAGAINSVAGGGTFLTFPIFIMYGLTPLQANVMSTVALWPGTITSSWGYRGLAKLERTIWVPLLTVCIIGGAAGSMVLLHTSEMVFTRLVPWLLLCATLIFTFGKHAISFFHSHFPNAKGSPLGGMILQLIIAFYGGYFGAGIGILTLAMLQIMGFSDMHQMNALKVQLAAAINASTVIIFIIAGAVLWKLAFVMVAGGMLGGYVGARMARKVAPEKIRLLVSLIAIAMTAYFFAKNA